MAKHPPQASTPDSKYIITRRAWLCLVVALTLSGFLLGLSFPRPGWWPLAYFALAPAGWIALVFPCAKRLAFAAWIVGSLWWLAMIGWLIPVTVGGYVALSLFLGLYLPATLLLMRWLNLTLRLPVSLALPLAWVSMEMVRSHVPSGGFGWFGLGQTQAAWLPEQSPGRIVQIASLLGEQGISLLLAMINGLWVDLALSRLKAGQSAKVKASELNHRGVFLANLIVAVLWASAWAYGQWTLSSTRLTSGPVVAVVQTNIAQSNKNRPTPASDRIIWEQLNHHTESSLASNSKPTLVVWPETMLPGPMNEQGIQALRANAIFWEAVTLEDLRSSNRLASLEELARSQGISLQELPAYMAKWMRQQADYRQKVRELARQHNISLLIGAGTTHEPPSGRRANSVYLVHPDGSVDPQRYDKIHLVPFGEYIPWVESWPWLKKQFIAYLSPYAFDYTLEPGWKIIHFQLRNPPSWSMSVSICFEEAVARLTRRMIYDQQGNKIGRFMVNLTNDGWFAGTDQQFQHMQIAALRCIELGVPAVRSVNTGVSGFIDSTGRVGPLVHKDHKYRLVDGWAVHQLTLDSHSTFFGWAGQWPMWGWTTLTGVLVLTGIGCRKRIR